MMKPDMISLRRRYLMIAGLAGAVTPVAVFASQSGEATVAELAASAGRGKLIVSGRILRQAGKPLSGAVIEILHASATGDASATTDADGRFMFTTAAASHVDYCVNYDGNTTPARQLRLAQPHRDETGTWRATFGLTLA